MYGWQLRKGFIGHVCVLLANVSLFQPINALYTGHIMQVKECWCFSIASCPNCSTSEGPHPMHTYFKHKITWLPLFLFLIVKVTARTFSDVPITKTISRGFTLILASSLGWGTLDICSMSLSSSSLLSFCFFCSLLFFVALF